MSSVFESIPAGRSSVEVITNVGNTGRVGLSIVGRYGDATTVALDGPAVDALLEALAAACPVPYVPVPEVQVLTALESADQAAALPDVAYCPGCGAQLPENAGCQNPGCDGTPPAPLSDGAMASLTGVLASVDVHTSRQGHGWADATLVNVSAAGPSGASWPASVPLRVPPREYATVADWLAAGVSVAVLVRADCRGDTPQLTVVDIRQPDGDETPPASVMCGWPASAVVDAYSPSDGRLHGSLDQAHYVCDKHVEAAGAGIRAAGLTAHYVASLPAGHRCGDVFDYTIRRMVRRWPKRGDQPREHQRGEGW